MGLGIKVKPYKQGASWYLRIPADIIKHTGLDVRAVEFVGRATGTAPGTIRISGSFVPATAPGVPQDD